MEQSELKQLLADPNRVIFDIPAQYQTDALGHVTGRGEALVFPLSTEEVSAVMRFAHSHRIPVTPRGAGTNLVGSTVPQLGGIILDLSKMNRILALDEQTLTAEVEPGVLLADFQSYVEQRGYFYPPDPGEKQSSIGGNISTNAGGMRAVKYGVTRDYVRALELVTADGTVLTVGSKNVKDASGLQLKQLVIGSEGTLAVITKCLLKLIPKPEYSCSVLIAYADLKTGAKNVLRMIQGNLQATAIEFVEQSVVSFGERFVNKRFPYSGAGSYLLLSFDGSRQEVEARMERARSLALDGGALEVLPLTDAQVSADVWSIRGCLVNAVEAVSEQEPIDIVVPIYQVEPFISFVSALEQESGVQMIRFGHAGDGNIHLCVMRGSRNAEDWARVKRQVLDRLYEQAYALGGLTSGEHGIGLSKRPFFLRETDPHQLALMNQIKNALDERHILNDGKSYITDT